MDKVIFGDNQFFGVNHMSLSKAVGESERFAKNEAIYRVLSDVNEIGIKTFMFTTHDRFIPIFDQMRKDTTFRDFKLVPCMPYAHKYADAVTELGIVGGVGKYLSGNIFLTGIKGAISLVSNDYIEMMKVLVDSELDFVKGFNLEAVFLQNVMTDLLLGLGMYEILGEYYTYIKKKYDVPVGVITMNLVKTTEVFTNVLHIDDVIICSPVNKIGFRMNPSQKEVENLLKLHKTPTIAMSVFASGAVPYREGIEYVSSLKCIDSILFGASTKEHIADTYNLIKSNLFNS